MTLYQRVLGRKFEELSPQLRQFHGASSPIEVRGEFSVRRGKGVLRNWIADCAGFPRDAETLPVHLRVEPRGSSEIWYRSFGDTPLVSRQWSSGGQLAERIGLVTLYFQVRVVEGRLQIDSVYSSVLGLALPGMFGPWAWARSRDTGGAMHIQVRIGFAPLGMLVEYSGEVRIVSGGHTRSHSEHGR
jgi:hypothetical protein